MQNRHKIKMPLIISLVITMIIATAVSSYATTAADKYKEADDARKKKENAEASITEMEKKYHNLDIEIQNNKQEIENTKANIDKKEKEIESQTNALGDRLTSMYKTGSAGIIDVILSSQDIEDLISNLGMVQIILKNDQDILRGLQDDLKNLDKLKNDLVAKEDALKVKQEEVESLREDYKEAAKKYEKQEESLRAEAQQLASIAASTSTQGEGKYSPTDFGTYQWPTASNWYYTSYYGWRIHPILGYKKYHSGYDIVLTSGTNGAPVYAAGNGYVTKASWYGGYGNCVMINVGNGYQTLYGHLSGYAVSAGQTVKKGQVVGYIGSTGMSTGPHLHFSLYKGSQLVDPLQLYN